MAMFHVVLLTEYISLSSYDLLEYLVCSMSMSMSVVVEYVVMLMTLILIINA